MIVYIIILHLFNYYSNNFIVFTKIFIEHILIKVIKLLNIKRVLTCLFDSSKSILLPRTMNGNDSGCFGEA